MSYNEKLIESAEKAGNVSCMGLDPKIESLPEKHKNKGIGGFVDFIDEITDLIVEEDASPAAFKPNFGFYLSHDEPMKKEHIGSDSLVDIINIIRHKFPDTPIIADFKTGDIGKSSKRYADSILKWDVDATVVHPYMGDDSVTPYIESFEKNDKGVYVLTRTSNKGAKSFQDLTTMHKELYQKVADKVLEWSDSRENVGSVVGATYIKELSNLAKMYRGKNVSMLIPGVGGQGGSAEETMNELRKNGYDERLARISSSSGITHPWKDNPVPNNYKERCVNNLKELNEKTAIYK
ncbi:MAG: orotidine-5'-phosphate decarboxylase [Nanobdellota archaeon]